jgi:hypothetical protein
MVRLPGWNTLATTGQEAAMRFGRSPARESAISLTNRARMPAQAGPAACASAGVLR